jgi:hypothetical protein
VRGAWLVVALSAGLAAAEPRPARDTADVGDKGSWSVGVFNPFRYAFHNRFEFQVNPLLFFVAPHADLRFAILKEGPGEHKYPFGVRLTAEAGLLYPTLAMRLAKGFLFPSWNTSTNDIGHMLIPRVALLVSGDFFTYDVLTFRLEALLRIPITQNNATPLNSSIAPLDILFAAPLTGFLGRFGGAYDHAFGEYLRLRLEANVYLTGTQGSLVVDGKNVGDLANLSPWIFTAHLGLDIATFKQSRITVGVYWANYDQGKSEVRAGADGFSERVRVRSNNFLPTIDYIWAGF